MKSQRVPVVLQVKDVRARANSKEVTHAASVEQEDNLACVMDCLLHDVISIAIDRDPMHDRMSLVAMMRSDRARLR